MVDTLNQVLEQSLSLRSWKWRVEAWRTGKTFAEVVLLRTLVYRVEQLPLVDRRAGLLLASVAASEIVPRDSQLISAMLTALQDFVSDSFEIDAQAGIREIHLGDFSLLVETGPRAALAAAVRGNAPAEFRDTLRAAIDLIHQEFVTELRDFRHDAKPFERSEMILEGCLQAQYQKQETHSYTRLWVLAAVNIGGAVVVDWAPRRGGQALGARRHRAAQRARNSDNAIESRKWTIHPRRTERSAGKPPADPAEKLGDRPSQSVPALSALSLARPRIDRQACPHRPRCAGDHLGFPG